uniref:Uncharacterized protein n=1 Tax=Paenibacillus brasilensis TaxID=128574 RepID=A0A3Q8GWU9_9BACL|nr:hypothetical protein PB24_107 [Paenibacillus brasilensis]
MKSSFKICKKNTNCVLLNHLYCINSLLDKCYHSHNSKSIL